MKQTKVGNICFLLFYFWSDINIELVQFVSYAIKIEEEMSAF